LKGRILLVLLARKIMPTEIKETDIIVKKNIENTNYYIEGIKIENSLWKVALVHSLTNKRINYRHKESFPDIIEMVVRLEDNHYPYMHKQEPNIQVINRFIKKILKNNIKTNGKHKSSRLNSKGRKLQSNCKKCSKNGANKSKTI